MKPGIVYSEKYKEHELTPTHPESPKRLEAIIDTINKDKNLKNNLEFISPTPANKKEIELAHSSSYVKKVKDHSKSGKMIDLDTPVNNKTYDLALLSAGGTLDLAEKIFANEFKTGFALVRPPGHHATRTQGGGFCFFNNIAIAASKLLEKEDIEDVLIFDFDSHHGNGTQDIFYNRNDVLYISFHQSGETLYPGSGFPKEIGGGKGEGFNVNIPFNPGSSNNHFLNALEEIFIPISEQFNPDIILTSAGFDAHEKDHLTNLNLTTNGFKDIAEVILKQSDKLCKGKTMFVLEGGYAVDAEAKSVKKILNSMINPETPEFKNKKAEYGFEEIKDILTPYWDL